MGVPSLKRFYLLAYNGAQALGWAAVLWLSLPLLLLKGPAFQHQMGHALQVAAYCQLAAGLEVVHALTGLVRGSWLPSLMQWGGRAHVIFAVVLPLEPLHNTFALVALLLAWSISEVIRYPQYFFTLAAKSPPWLTWLRYSAFLVLYPIGVFVGEMPLMMKARPLALERNLYAGFFQYFPFNYSQFLLGLLMVYPLLWLQLFVYMLRQRTSKLKAEKRGKAE